MMDPGPRLKYVRVLTAQLFNAKTAIEIVTWNVFTMQQCGKVQQVFNEMKSYKLDILGVSEMGCTGNDRTANEGTTILFSGQGTKTHIIEV